MALVYIRPDADVIDGSWVNESANNTNLYDSLNETSPIDTDFIRSSNNPANDIVTLRLSNFAGVVTQPMAVHYRYKAVSTSGDPLSLKVRLIQGAGGSPATTVAEWQHSDAAVTYQDASQTLTTDQFNAISDFDDLFLEFEAITGMLQISALALLAGETDGFAIDATDLIAPAYVGGPNGGCVAVIDTGTPANDLSDVPMDASNLTQSGTSPKMVLWNSAPYVRWTPHNLMIQSQTFDDASWNKHQCSVTANATTAPDGTSTADKLVEGDFTDIHELYVGYTAVSGFVYTWSGYVKAAERTWIAIKAHGGTTFALSYFDVGNGVTGTNGSGNTSSITSVGNGWYRITLTRTTDGTSAWFSFLPATADNAASYDGDGTSGIYIWGAQVNRGSTPTPYLVTTTAARIGIPQEYDTAASKFGILVEPAATNIATNSEAFGSWTGSGASVSSNSTTAPDGASTADTLVEDTSNGRHIVYFGSVTVGTTVSGSVFLKAKERTAATVALVSTLSKYHSATVDLSNGTITQNNTGGAPTSTNHSVVSVGNGWYRLIVNIADAGTDYYLMISPSNSTTPTVNADGCPTYLGDGSSGIYAWGAQLENSSVATSYIPTLGSTVTRARDIIEVVPVTTFPYSGTTDSWFAYWKPKEYSVAQPTVLSADNAGNANERIHLRADSGNLDVVTGGVDGWNNAVSDLTANTANKQAVRIKANDLGLSVNGAAAVTDVTASLPTVSANPFRIGGNNFGASCINGYIYQLIIVPTAWNDATLASKAT